MSVNIEHVLPCMNKEIIIIIIIIISEFLTHYQNATY